MWQNEGTTDRKAGQHFTHPSRKLPNFSYLPYQLTLKNQRNSTATYFVVVAIRFQKKTKHVFSFSSKTWKFNNCKTNDLSWAFNSFIHTFISQAILTKKDLLCCFNLTTPNNGFVLPKDMWTISNFSTFFYDLLLFIYPKVKKHITSVHHFGLRNVFM